MAEEHLENEVGGEPPRSDVDVSYAVVQRLERENIALRDQLSAARDHIESSRRALALLTEPALQPALALDYRACFASIAEALVASVADGCTIDQCTETGDVALAVAHVDRRCEPVLRDPVRREAERLVGGAVMRIPLSARGTALGVLTIWSKRRARFEPAELPIVHWIAHHLAVLMDNRRLEAAADAASNASETLLSMVSHELRTPLAIISMGVEASMLRIADSADAFPREWLLERLDKAKKAVAHTDRLIHTFLGMSQITTGQLAPDPQDTDVAALLRRVVEALRDELGWAGCDYDLHAPRPERGSWDPLQLEIVLTNLVTNAIKYAPGKPVSLRVDGGSDWVTVTVSDAGLGIAKEHQQALFQRFSRLPSGSRVHGFGLGLWITKHFVEANGGSIELESELGRGATFTVRLPRSGRCSAGATP